MLAVDTNVLVYAADADSQFHGPCRDWLERQRARPALEHLVAGISPENRHRELEWGPPVGNEVW